MIGLSLGLSIGSIPVVGTDAEISLQDLVFINDAGTPRISGVTGTEIELIFDPPSRVAGSHTIPLAAISSGPYAIGPLAWNSGSYNEDDEVLATRPVWVNSASNGPISFSYSTTGNGSVTELDAATLSYQATDPDGGSAVQITEIATDSAGSTALQSAALSIAGIAPTGPLVSLLAPTEIIATGNSSSLTAASVLAPTGPGNGLLIIALNWSASSISGKPTVTVDYGSGPVAAAVHFSSFDLGTAFQETGSAFYTVSVPYGSTITTAVDMGTTGQNFTSNARITHFMGTAQVTGGFAQKGFAQGISHPLLVPAGSTLIATCTAYGNARAITFPNGNLETVHSSNDWNSSGVAHRNNQTEQADGTVDVSTASIHHIALSALVLEAT